MTLLSIIIFGMYQLLPTESIKCNKISLIEFNIKIFNKSNHILCQHNKIYNKKIFTIIVTTDINFQSLLLDEQRSIAKTLK